MKSKYINTVLFYFSTNATTFVFTISTDSVKPSELLKSDGRNRSSSMSNDSGDALTSGET